MSKLGTLTLELSVGGEIYYVRYYATSDLVFFFVVLAPRIHLLLLLYNLIPCRVDPELEILLLFIEILIYLLLNELNLLFLM